MALLNVNPTRAELRTLTDRLAIAARGHKLLKDKQDSMIRRFIDLVDKTRVQRRLVEEKMQRIFYSYRLAGLSSDDDLLQLNLNASEYKMEVQPKLSEQLGVRIPKFFLDETSPRESLSGIFLTPEVWEDMDQLRDQLNVELIRLAEMEKAAILIGQEIVATRRRVNALEFRTIPDLEETISYIRMKIEDSERNRIATLIKV